MDKVNELGRTITEEALKKLDIKERVIIVDGQKLYAKEVKKNFSSRHFSNSSNANIPKTKANCLSLVSE